MKKKVDEQREQLVDNAGLAPAEAAATVVSESGRGLTVNTARHTFAEDYVHAVNPDIGVTVVFVPGEALPEWAAQAQAKHTPAMLAGLGLLGSEPPEPGGKRPVKGRLEGRQRHRCRVDMGGCGTMAGGLRVRFPQDPGSAQKQGLPYLWCP